MWPKKETIMHKYSFLERTVYRLAGMVEFTSSKNSRVFAFIWLIALLLHAGLLLFYTGPFNLYIDSAGYLSTADNLFATQKFSWNPNRPIGLPSLYFLLLAISQKKLIAIVGFQIFCFYISIYTSIKILFPKKSLNFHLFIMLIVVFLSLRTFLYSYMILSESLFASLIILACSLAISYANDAAHPQSREKKLKYIFLCCLATALIKSIGAIFLAASIFLYIYHYFFVNNKKSLWLLVAIALPLALTANYAALGTMGFSKQEGIQLLISANQYINYNSPFMTDEKRLIKESHQEILRRYSPRTRLDQMVGPVEGVKTPAEILLNTSKDYDEFNSKIRKLLIEGLLSNNNWAHYAWDGCVELYKLIVGDTKEGLILPGFIGNVNKDVLNYLPTFSEKNPPGHFSEQVASGYYAQIVRYTLFPKYISFGFLIISLLIAFFLLRHQRKARIIIQVVLVALLCIADLYLSSLLVFALDRYYAGVEVVFWILAIYLMVTTWEVVSGRIRNAQDKTWHLPVHGTLREFG